MKCVVISKLWNKKCITILLLFFKITVQQNADGKPCVTFYNETGVCTDVYKCQAFINIITTKTNNSTALTYLRRSVCDNNRVSLIVCCPKTDNNALPTTNKLLRPPNCGVSNYTTLIHFIAFPAELGQFPWMVILGYKNIKNPDSPKWLCEGTLISLRHVLTAAYCVNERSDLYLARVGDFALSSDSDNAHPQDILLERGEIHDDYNPLKGTNNIAILKLSKKVTHPAVWPVCLPVDPLLKNQRFDRDILTEAFWGSTKYRGRTNLTFKTYSMEVIDLKVCKAHLSLEQPSYPVIDNRVLCTASPRYSQNEDGGGPLMYIKSTLHNTIVTQIGIVSYISRYSLTKVYTRVGSFIDWIENNMV